MSFKQTKENIIHFTVDDDISEHKNRIQMNIQLLFFSSRLKCESGIHLHIKCIEIQ